MVCELARRQPAAASIAAERIRADRTRWRHEVHLPLSTDVGTIRDDVAAAAVGRSGCVSLAATAMLQLEEHHEPAPAWAHALVAIAGDVGRRHLERMRPRPGWSGLVGASPAETGPDALVSPIADVRRSAIESLAAAPRPQLLRALLLAVELDRYVVRDVLQRPWVAPQVTGWLPILANVSTGVDRDLATIPSGYSEFFDAVASTRATHLLVDLVDVGSSRVPLATAQDLSPPLRELEADGPATFVARHIPDPRLTAEELRTLDQGESELAAAAERWWR
jgi:hypothetical protein